MLVWTVDLNLHRCFLFGYFSEWPYFCICKRWTKPLLH